jgi:glucose-6-phosphate 1-epimerase
MASSTVEELNRKFAIDQLVRFEEGNGGLIRARINTPAGQGEMYLHGAQVTQFHPRSQQQPVLFLSNKSHYEPQKPIRGGVPICFPWFGPRQGDASSPMHGFARLSEWEVTATQKLPDGRVSITMTLRDNDSTRKLWAHKFTARYTATFGNELELQLAVRNDDGEAFTFEEALHTYVLVGDVAKATLSGLGGVEYLDKVAGGRPRQGDAPMQISGETDRVYLATQSTCVIADPILKRQTQIEKQHSGTTVVWNPWDKVTTIADLAPQEGSKFLCVETANAKEQALRLSPGQEHIIKAVLRVTSL